MSHRISRGVLAFALVGLLPCAGTRADAQDLGPEKAITEWQMGKSGSRIQTSGDGPLADGANRGWVRSKQGVVDVRLRAEFRLLTDDAEGAVLLRAWTDQTDSWPKAGYGVRLRAGSTASDPIGRVTGVSRAVTRSVSSASPSEVTVGEWHTLEVTCVDNTVTVTIDGLVVDTVVGAEPAAGHVGFEIRRGRIETRHLRIAELRYPLPGDVLDLGTETLKGLALPRLRREVTPRYTADAMLRRVEGSVELKAVVEVDGSVRRVWVSRTLIPDLDAEAVAAARRWTFAPALFNGTPTPVMVRIVMQFRLE